MLIFNRNEVENSFKENDVTIQNHPYSKMKLG